MKAFALPAYVLLLDVILLNNVVESNYTDHFVYPTSYGDLHGTNTTYSIFTIPRSWNDARAVCKSIGGDLAKVPSDIDVTAMKAEHDTVKQFFNGEYFSGAVRHTQYQYVWVSDCTTGTVSSSASRFQSFDHGETYPACVNIHGDHFDQVDCESEAFPFFCEMKTKTPCNLVKILDTDVVKLDYMNESDCNELCNGDVTCWAAITTPTHCIKATIPGYGLSSLSMSTKHCQNTYDVQIREDNINLTEGNHNDETRECENSNGSSSSVPIPTPTDPPVTSSSTLPNPTSPGPPEVITSTKIVMSTQFTTMYVTSTEHIVGPTKYVTITVTATIEPITAMPTSSRVVNDQAGLQLIPPKTTSTHRRSLTSAMDMRRTSIVIGTFSIALVIIPMWTIILSDVKAIIRHFRNHRTIYSN